MIEHWHVVLLCAHSLPLRPARTQGGAGRAMMWDGTPGAELRTPLFDSWGDGTEIAVSLWFRADQVGGLAEGDFSAGAGTLMTMMTPCSIFLSNAELGEFV